MKFSLISKIRLCSSAKHLQQLHGFLLTTGLHHDNLLMCKFIEACSRTGLSDYGYSVFKHKPRPCIYLYNTMIKSLSSLHSSAQDAICVFNNIRASGLSSDSYSFPFALKAATWLLDVNVGNQIHGQVIKSGFVAEIHTGIATVKMYSAGGWMEDARQVFDEMSSSNDVALWNAMAAGYAGARDMDHAMQLFENMPERNVISWTTMISGYVHVNQPNKAIEIFLRMRAEDVKLDEVALLAALSACADLGMLELGYWIHEFIDEHNLYKSVPLHNALIDMYVKSGNIRRALEVFESMEHKNVVTWTTMITGLAFHGLGREALGMFSRMEISGARPNDITFIGVLSACSHVGFVELGHSYFESMSSKYGVVPKIQHYGCMVDLLGRAGCLDEAEDLVKKMPFHTNAALWGSLLAAARLHGNYVLAAKALGCLSVLEPDNSGNYSLLSNTYAGLGRWNEARLVRKTMRSSSVKKLPGGSSIEVNNAVFNFVAGYVSYPDAKRIYEALRGINRQCKMEAYEQNIHENLLIE